MAPLLENLNPEQLAAVTLPSEHALILAGAGSGKTRVLTTRIAWLIQTGSVSPSGLLAVTFTNKAAREMLTRISAMLPINVRGMWVGTFHGVCNRLLRTHHQEAGLPQLFQILDAQDQLAAVKRVLKSLNADEARFPAREVQYFINAAKEEGRRPSQLEVADEFARRGVDFYAAYEEQCRKEGVVDFAELLLRSYELLQRNEPLRSHYQSRFRHVLVDEFQDTNRLQYRWLKLLAGHGGSLRAPAGGADSSMLPATALFAVGDDDQSIYRFRGANVGNMSDFEREFEVPNVIRLEQNYRSHGNILAAANALISHNRRRLGKNLWTSAGEGEPLRVVDAASDARAAGWVGEEVQGLARDGLPLREIAVLYRSNAQSRILEHALFSQGIAYRVYGGLRFFERMEIKHALAYLRLAASTEDDGAFLRIVNFPARGIGARTLEQLQEAASKQGTSLYGAAASLPGKAGATLSGFVRMIETLRGETAKLPLPEIVDAVLDRSGLLAHYRAERDGADRVENLLELVNAAAAFVQEEEANDLATFLAHAALESGENQAAEGADALQMMTVHSAKGLEFQAVFITGLEEGLFPHEQSVSEDDGLEEERRLMYVALTRARTRLYLSFAQTRLLHGQTRYNIASRFLDEVPGALLKWLTPRLGAALPERNAWTEPLQRAPRARDPGHGFRIGQSVVHARFGQGVIVSAEGSGSDARLQVNFGRQGMKWLALEYAKLAPA
ncbi:MAG: UvrD-helicase domain-containing protein [Burkholderiales bacterium]|nr:UvrD-helicase domain-containing protein [Burkholderiales bacterium]